MYAHVCHSLSMPEDCQRAIETLQIKFIANYRHKSKIQLLSNIAECGNMTLKDYSSTCMYWRALRHETEYWQFRFQQENTYMSITPISR